MLDLTGRTEQVTRQDIDNGICKDFERCPMAKALLRMIPEAEGVQVDTDSVDVHIPELDKPIELVTSDEVQIWIQEFDDEIAAEPVKIGIANLVLEIQ